MILSDCNMSGTMAKIQSLQFFKCSTSCLLRTFFGHKTGFYVAKSQERYVLRFLTDLFKDPLNPNCKTIRICLGVLGGLGWT